MRERPESLFKPKLQKPFGLVDDDYGNTSEMCDKEGVEPGRVSILKRHSLENYTYDPFILSSLLSDDELKENIGNASLRNALIDLKNSKTQPEAQKAVDQYFSDIFKIIESEEKMKELSKNVNAVFNKIEFTSALLDKKDVGKIGGEAKIALKRSDDFRSKDGKKDVVSDFVRKNYWLYKQDSKKFIKVLEGEIQEKVNDFIRDKYSEDDIVVKIDLSKFELTLQSGEKEVAPSDDGNKMSKIPANDIDIYIVGRDYKIKYPRDFLAARGHDIEDTFLVMENAEDAKSFAKYYEFKEGIVNFFHDKIEGVQFPADLLSVYNELSNAIRTQVNKVAKDESYEVKDEKKFTQEKWEYRVKKTKAPSLAV